MSFALLRKVSRESGFFASDTLLCLAFWITQYSSYTRIQSTFRTTEGEQPLIARTRGTLYRTQYNIHSNFTTVTHGTPKEK